MKFLLKFLVTKFILALRPVTATCHLTQSDPFIDVTANIDTPGSHLALSLPLLIHSSSKVAPAGVLSRAL